MDEEVADRSSKEEAQRQTVTDRALVRLDESEIKARMLEAFDGLVKLGFAVHLIAVQARAATEYQLALYSDGIASVPGERLQEIADRFRLDFTIENDRSLDGWTVVFYPRW